MRHVFLKRYGSAEIRSSGARNGARSRIGDGVKPKGVLNSFQASFLSCPKVLSLSKPSALSGERGIKYGTDKIKIRNGTFKRCLNYVLWIRVGILGL